MLLLWLLNEALKVVEPPYKSSVVNDSALLKDGSVILRALLTNA